MVSAFICSVHNSGETKGFYSPQDVDVITPNPISFEYLFYHSSPLGACCQIAKFILNGSGEDNPAVVVVSGS